MQSFVGTNAKRSGYVPLSPCLVSLCTVGGRSVPFGTPTAAGSPVPSVRSTNYRQTRNGNNCTVCPARGGGSAKVAGRVSQRAWPSVWPAALARDGWGGMRAPLTAQTHTNPYTTSPRKEFKDNMTGKNTNAY